ncbi:helix-turn-helix domain-containing protein [Streptomyces sp. LE64]|uniref:helix-turn-helix domain-containing protein n=1 Tax=Streptomyces sp. LE64 TaxID=3448653 RepID=UPI004042C8C5
MTATTPPAPPASGVPTLGERLRSARRARGESIRGLARRIGCSASLLSQIELGKSAPSVGVLYQLARALDVSTDHLLGPAPQEDPAPRALAPVPRTAGFGALRALPPTQRVQVQRATDRQTVSFGGGVRWERLTTTSDTRVDFLEIVYEPGGSSDEDDHPVDHPGVEYGVVVEGELTVDVDAESHTLGPGDSVAFDSGLPHLFRNTGTSTARAVWFVVHAETGPGYTARR